MGCRPPEVECKLFLQKARTQEEFIRGSMKKNPYSSKDIGGPLMADVRDKICRDLGLVASASMFELLVAGKLISFELPIEQVFEKGELSVKGSCALLLMCVIDSVETCLVGT